jgi:hypothetical protein
MLTLNLWHPFRLKMENSVMNTAMNIAKFRAWLLALFKSNSMINSAFKYPDVFTIHLHV